MDAKIGDLKELADSGVVIVRDSPSAHRGQQHLARKHSARPQSAVLSAGNLSLSYNKPWST